jgi:hypothetical protein
MRENEPHHAAQCGITLLMDTNRFKSTYSGTVQMTRMDEQAGAMLRRVTWGEGPARTIPVFLEVPKKPLLPQRTVACFEHMKDAVEFCRRYDWYGVVKCEKGFLTACKSFSDVQRTITIASISPLLWKLEPNPAPANEVQRRLQTLPLDGMNWKDDMGRAATIRRARPDGTNWVLQSFDGTTEGRTIPEAMLAFETRGLYFTTELQFLDALHQSMVDFMREYQIPPRQAFDAAGNLRQ